MFLSKYGSMEFGNLSLASIVTELLDILNTHQIKVPANVSMLARGLVTLEGVLAFLNPNINIIDIAANHIKNSKDIADEFVKKLQRMAVELEGSFEKVALIPGYTVDILKMVAKGQAKINSELQISETAQSFIDRMLNRIIIGMIIVAVIVGSSLIALVDIQPVVFNLPLFTTIGYVIAAALSFSLFRGKYK